MRLDYLCTYLAENLEFLYTPVHVHMVIMHKYKTVMMVHTHCECMTNYGFIHVSFVQNVAHVRLFSIRAHEFPNWENIC